MERLLVAHKLLCPEALLPHRKRSQRRPLAWLRHGGKLAVVLVSQFCSMAIFHERLAVVFAGVFAPAPLEGEEVGVLVTRFDAPATRGWCGTGRHAPWRHRSEESTRGAATPGLNKQVKLYKRLFVPGKRSPLLLFHENNFDTGSPE